MMDAPLILLAFALAILVGLMTALIARAKGRSFIGWLVYGAFSSPIALFHALLMASKRPAAGKKRLPAAALRRCPHCGDSVKRDLEVCPHCWRVLPAEDMAVEPEDDA